MNRLAIVAALLVSCGSDPSSAEERRGFARKIAATDTTGDLVVSTSGTDETTLEIYSKAEGCSRLELLSLRDKHQEKFRSFGFRKLKCANSGDEVTVD